MSRLEVIAEVHDFRLKRDKIVHVCIVQNRIRVLLRPLRNVEHLLDLVELFVPFVQVSLDLLRRDCSLLHWYSCSLLGRRLCLHLRLLVGILGPCWLVCLLRSCICR